MRLWTSPFLCLFSIAISSPKVIATFPTVALKAVALKQIHSPTTITHAPDGSGRLFVCDQLGKIYIIQKSMLLPTPFLNIASSTNLPSNGVPNTGLGQVIAVTTGYSERGLLGLAFHPQFSIPATPGYRKFYVNYTKAPGAGDPAAPGAGDPVNCVTVIAEFEVSATNPNLAVPASERRLLMFTQPQNNHNGGQLEFGPDGLLYIGTGDGGGSNDNSAGHTGSAVSTLTCLGNGQDKTRFLGKILRINPIDPDGEGPLNYSIPPSNPFVGAGSGVKEEIYAFGMRNPWKFSFDKRPGGTNRLFCGDVGQGRVEEINLILSGGNYGWRYKEGSELPIFSAGTPVPSGSVIDPIAMYAHPGVLTSPVLPQLGLSVTGGFVYRGSAIPALQGKYVFGDYGSTTGASDGRLMGLEETAPSSGIFTLTQAITLFASANPIVGQRILCLGEDESGEIYIGMKSNAGVLALDPVNTGMPAGGIYKIVPLQSSSATISASKDNTLFSDTTPRPPITGYPSDALGYLYAGQTGTNHGPYLRRALISFDLATQIPANAIIQSAQLSLRLTKLGPSSFGSPMTLHRLTQTWGEGTSVNLSDVGIGAQATTNDATWTHRFFNTQTWTAQGGSYNAAASANTTVTFPTVTLATNPQMVSDVQGWITTPASNAGWILRGDETTQETAVQICSVQKGPTPPSLQMTYLVPAPPTHFESWLTSNFPTNLTGQYVDPEDDGDGDGITNQIEYAYGLSPVTPDPTNDFSLTTEAGVIDANSTDLRISFRRDTLATDLTYKLQISSDLINWTTIAESVAGVAAIGQNGATIETESALDNSVNLVQVKINLAAGNNSQQFTRLQVDRF